MHESERRGEKLYMSQSVVENEKERERLAATNPNRKTFWLDLSFPLRIRSFDKTFNPNQNQFSQGVTFPSTISLFSPL